MIIVTGGAGFIGSALIWKLNQMGEDNILVVDHLGQTEKWKNLCALHFNDYLEKADFLQRLKAGSFHQASIKAIFHLGACSSTTETDATYLIENNYEYSKQLAEFAVARKIRLIYASSAATYGSGEKGYGDNEKLLPSLMPMNMYGYSKHMMDLWAWRKGYLRQIVGLKYFNVFGPNEYHKGEMRSMVVKAFEQIRESGKVRLFKSCNSEYADGEQVRDFLYIKDAVDMTLYFMEKPEQNGIFNIGSGSAVTWKQLVQNLFDALGQKPNIVYIDMPPELADKYQYHTCADISKLQKAGYQNPVTNLTEAVKEYTEYLKSKARLGELKTSAPPPDPASAPSA